MSDSVTTGEELCQFGFVVQRRSGICRARQFSNSEITIVYSAGDDHDVVPCRSQRPCQMTSDETGAARNCDLHAALPLTSVAIRRTLRSYRIDVRAHRMRPRPLWILRPALWGAGSSRACRIPV